MSSSLDMSLDDLIKNNKKSGSRGGGRGSSGPGPGPGPSRRLPNRAPNRATPYVLAPEMTWQHDMFANQAAMMGLAAARIPAALETGTKLYVSNLDDGVTNEDIKELFSEVGDLKRYSIHYDRSGRSKGTAEVVFSRRDDAVAAVKRYNNVQLDGKLMNIEIVGTNVATPTLPPLAVFPFGSANGGVPRGGQGRGGAIGRLRGSGGGGRGGFGTSRGRRKGGRGEKVTAEDLDADLEKYHSEAVDVDIETETN